VVLDADHERQERVDAMAHWMKAHAPDIRVDLAVRYAQLFYDANAASVDRLAKKLARNPQVPYSFD